MIIYVVRHGETDVNLENKINSLNDDDLNETGISQAKMLREQLKSVDYDLIICSPLTRTKHTAILLNYKNLNIIYDDRLLERDADILTKMPLNIIDSNDWWNINPKNNYYNAESVKHVIERVYGFLDDIKNKYIDKNIILVTHGGVSKAVSSYFYGIPEDGNLEKYKHNNCEIHQFELK